MLKPAPAGRASLCCARLCVAINLDAPCPRPECPQ
jgi:hypothetical protein